MKPLSGYFTVFWGDFYSYSVSVELFRGYESSAGTEEGVEDSVVFVAPREYVVLGEPFGILRWMSPFRIRYFSVYFPHIESLPPIPRHFPY